MSWWYLFLDAAQDKPTRESVLAMTRRRPSSALTFHLLPVVTSSAGLKPELALGVKPLLTQLSEDEHDWEHTFVKSNTIGNAFFDTTELRPPQSSRGSARRRG